MKLSSDAVDAILHVIETFDRERGIPHDYRDLEVVLKKTVFATSATGELVISAADIKLAAAPQAAPGMSGMSGVGEHRDARLDEGIEGRSMLLQAAREWLE